MAISPGRAPFDVNDDFTPLRKPHIREVKKPTNTTTTQPQRPSLLSATAQTFVPKSSNDLASVGQPQIVIQPNSVTNRLIRIQHPVEYAAALSCSSNSSNFTLVNSSCQRFVNSVDKSQSNLSSECLQPSEVETIALKYLATVIQCLNTNPGSFDSVATRFLTVFDGMENNEYVLSNAMEDIFNESIENPNFRYMGAKLYNLLHMLNLKDDSLFHTLLKYKLDYLQTEIMQFMQSDSEQKVRETALFLAELYMQLRGDDSRIKLIAENIVFCLKQMLTKISKENIHCICLTLKLAGYDLEEDCNNDINIIMEKLRKINENTSGTYPLIQNVIALAKKNWGRIQFDDQVHASKDANNSNLATPYEPTFYGPDGKIMTQEESSFLATNIPQTPSTVEDDDEYDSDIDLDQEMDEETEKAYRKFCKLGHTEK